MPSHPEPGTQEHPSTYIIKNRADDVELQRLNEQDRLFTTSMGGVLPEQHDPAALHTILDVGCGPGWWLIETARTYPAISSLIGLDINSRMVEFGILQAKAAGVANRVRFQTGDALRLLEFPDHTFNLVNQRLAMSFLRKWDWPKFLRECQRVCVPGGIIRITEALLPTSTSPSLDFLFDLLRNAFYHAGHLFTPERDGVTLHLAKLMNQYGIVDIHTKNYECAFGPANPYPRSRYIHDMHILFENVLPFLRKWTRVPGNYEEIYLQMVNETSQASFETSIFLLTAWGAKRHATLPGWNVASS